MDKYMVYAHINKENGKVYVGQTKNIKRRWEADGIHYKGSTYFYHAIQKYGWNSFEHIILEKNLTKQEADDLECYYIDYYNSRYDQNGYNIREGGSRQLSEETKKKISETQKNKGQWQGDKNPRHLHPLFGEENGMYGKNHTEEIKNKISQANKGKVRSDEFKKHISEQMRKNHPRAKKVMCVETGEIFLSSRQAAEKYNLGNSTISRICNGQRKPRKGGYHWRWIEEKEKSDD